ncbi:response regulator [Bdellovibrio sp. HCB209]|uniref:response regulator n=1 Tax=Bdellovibrio sp. HCB209 TaxID=3394354 RepID=UPI0039B39F1D
MKTVDVLIVDDRMDGLLALQAVLNIPNVNLVKAQSGPEALAVVDNYDFAVILLDVQMPGMDGFETAQRIRQSPRHRQTPIIFVTAINKDDQYIYRGYEVGAVDYIFKPFEPHIVRAKVNVFVELFLKSKQLEEQAQVIRENEARERYLRLAELEVESLRRYRSLADAIPHIIWRAKADGTFDYFNKGWTDYTGLSIEQSLGSGWQSAANEDDLKEFLKTWMNSMKDGRSFETECRIINRYGESRWFWVRAVSETNFMGQVVAWIGTCTDIHDRKNIEMKLIDAEKQANAASVSKTNFLANMSHEIRTPMNAILGFTELMLDEDQTPEERAKWIHTVQRNGDQLLKIIDEILDISKVESGRLQIENVEVDVESVLEDIRSLLRLQALDKRLDFRIDLDTSIPKMIMSDATRLRQILLNLIGNAIKFTGEGHVHVDVEWVPRAALELHSKIQFFISDSGVGINPAHSNHLFQPFVQEDSATTRNFGGTGLGLALSRQLARAMGGDVTLVSSVPGKGSTFLVEVNADPVEGTVFIESLNFHIPQNEKFSLKGVKKLENMNILLVEDVEDNQALISHFLGAVGANVAFADNGREGMAAALAHEYDAVLMDIQMPIMDGYEATRRLRAQGYDKPIVALTAHALKEEMVKSMSAGCTYHLAKPVNFSQLIDVLTTIYRDRGPREDHCAV